MHNHPTAIRNTPSRLKIHTTPDTIDYFLVRGALRHKTRNDVRIAVWLKNVT
jgi:hypothetical protein